LGDPDLHPRGQTLGCLSIPTPLLNNKKVKELLPLFEKIKDDYDQEINKDKYIKNITFKAIEMIKGVYTSPA
jgi:hypothetical protein